MAFWNLRLRRGGWIDPPRDDRHSDRAVPRTGGAGWITGWMVGTALAVFLGTLTSRGGVYSGSLVGLAFLLGLLDDHGRVGGALKGAVALLLLAFFLRASLGFQPLVPIQVSPLQFAAVLVVVGALQLAFQIFDNLDGVVGATAAVGCLHLAAGAGTSELALLALLGAGCSAGFLAWNRPPARVFLGNAGSQAVGLLVAGLVGAALLRAESPRAGVSVLLPFSWPLFDLVFVVLRRVREGRSPWTGGRDHSTHVLARRFGADGPVFFAVLGAAILLALVAHRL